MLLAGAVALVLLAAAPHAPAKVHFDPESPAGKEYALPLDQARDEAAGAGKSDGPAGKKAQLFGEGISKQGSNAAPGSSAGNGGTQGGNGGGGGGGGDKNGPQGQEQRQLSASVVAVSSNDRNGYALSSATLWIAAILALAGLAGFALRAVQRSRD
jgi:hypothetical protein